MTENALLGDLTARRARLDGTAVALICGDQRVDFKTLEASACRAGNALIELGVGRGDRVAALMRNSIDYVVLYYAVARIGAILCPLNWRLAPPEIAAILGHSEVSLLLYDSEFSSIVDALSTLSRLDDRIVDGADFNQLAARASSVTPVIVVAADDPLLLVYTSGTTGAAKGAVLTHRKMLWTSLTMAATLDYRRRDVDLIAAPLFHVGGLSFVTLSVHLGATAVILPAWDPASVLDLVAREQINHFFAVAAMLEALVAHPGFATAELDSVRWIMAGGAPVPISLIQTFAARAIPLVQTYGATETGGPATVVDTDHALTKAGSAGLPFFHTDIRIANGAGGIMATDEVGEIQVRAPHVGTYWRDQFATEAAFVDGWFRMGDFGYLDADGYLFLLGRRNDLIVSGGENVYPAEIEALLSALREIEEVAVLGIADKCWGELVCAIVVLADGQEISLETINAYCDGRIARYKTPRRLVIRSNPLPRNATGKVLRNVLKDELKVDNA